MFRSKPPTVSVVASLRPHPHGGPYAKPSGAQSRKTGLDVLWFWVAGVGRARSMEMSDDRQAQEEHS